MTAIAIIATVSTIGLSLAVMGITFHAHARQALAALRGLRMDAWKP